MLYKMLMPDVRDPERVDRLLDVHIRKPIHEKDGYFYIELYDARENIVFKNMCKQFKWACLPAYY